MVCYRPGSAPRGSSRDDIGLPKIAIPLGSHGFGGQLQGLQDRFTRLHLEHGIRQASGKVRVARSQGLDGVEYETHNRHRRGAK
jgi:hypothetical protein